MTVQAIDEAKVEQFVNQAVGELGATLNAALVVIGDRLGLYKALAGAGALTPGELAERDGLEVRAYVHDLYRHLTACDLAIVQGGLTTAMELTANKRPFLVFPLRHHFEQNLHVRHRLERYGAGRFMDFEHDGPEQIADAIADEIGREVDYLDVETGGAGRAARSIAELL